MDRTKYFFSQFFLLILFSSLFSQPKIALQSFTSGFSQPVDIASAGDGRLFIVEQGGKIFIVDEGGTVNNTPFLDIANKVTNAGERGLLGLAFHPNFGSNGYYYVNYVSGNESRVSRFTVNPQNPDVTLVASEKSILTLAQPFTNHNGGDLAFGPQDGYLYIGFGDGGSGNDPQDNGQKTTTFHGKILRIDVDNGDPYGIPADNPFVANANVLDEIWSLGWRNPWRFSFDRQTGDMWIGDVGQGKYEEVSLELASSTGGLNFGWRCREGDNDFNTNGCGDISQYVAPVFEYRHGFNLGFSITGGFVYRGQDFPGLQGHYIFGDYNTGRIWTLFPNENGGFDSTQQGKFFGTDELSTFGEDANGEVYVAEYKKGVIYKVTDTSTGLLPLGETLPVKIYPHPFKSRLTVAFDNPNQQSYTLKLINLQGQVVREIQDIRSNELTLDRKNLPSGLYLIELRGEKVFGGKVLVE